MSKFSDIHLKAKPFVFAVGRFFRNLYKEFTEKGCQRSAAALTYMSLFAMVPLMAVFYSIFSMFPAFEGTAQQLQEMAFSHFVPETGNEIQEYLANFSQQARNLSAAGAGLLVVTAYLMLTNIEKTFNNIWGVKAARRGLTSFLLYWAVLTIGPLLLGFGLGMSTYLLSLKMIVSEYDALGVSGVLFGYLPWITTSAAFTLLFAAVPNCRVPIKFAFIGGVVTAICFELLKIGFGLVVANSSFSQIYGAFAVVPLFLLWVNLLWMIILAGAVFVRTLAERGYAHSSSRYTDLMAVLQILAIFREKARSGESVSDSECVRAGVGLVHWQQLRSTLSDKNWIAVTDSGNYVLCRDLGAVSVWDAACLVGATLAELEAMPKKSRRDQPWLQSFVERKQRLAAQAKDHYGLSLDALYSEQADDSECLLTSAGSEAVGAVSKLR